MASQCVRCSAAGHGPTLFAGLSKRIDLKLVSRLEFGSGAMAMRMSRDDSYPLLSRVGCHRL